VPYPVKNSSDSGRRRGAAAALWAAVALAVVLGCTRSGERVESPGPVPAPSAGMPTAAPAGIPAPLWTNFQLNSDVHALAFQGNNVWVGTEGGLLRYDLDRDVVAAKYDTGSGLLSNDVTSLDYAPDGGLWVGTHGGGLVHIGKDGTWTHYSVPDLGDPFVYRVLADRSGTGYWVATWSGLSHFDGKRWRTYTKADGLVDDWVYAMAQDADGTLWLGTEGGVGVLKGGAFTALTHADGLGADKDRVGGYEVIGNPSKHHSQTPGKSADGYNPNYVLSVLIDRQGNKWFGTWGAGLSRYDGAHWTTYTRKDGLAGNYVTDLYADRDGSIWATTDAGVSVLQGGRWRTYTKADGLVSDGVYTIAVDPEGNKWFGAMGGVSRLEPLAGLPPAGSPAT
jgi:ligand-binding sensor domain-containing protein